MEPTTNNQQPTTTAEIEKIEIPDEPQTQPANAKTLADLMKLSISEEKKIVPLDKFKWSVALDTNSDVAVITKIQNEKELLDNLWHFIPFTIPEEDRPQNNNKKYQIIFFCVDDKKTKKRFTNTIRKYFPFQIVDWQPFDAVEYKKELENYKK